MSESIDQLTQKVEQLVGVVRQLRDENQSLRMQLADRTAIERALELRLERARDHVSAALARLPHPTSLDDQQP